MVIKKAKCHICGKKTRRSCVRCGKPMCAGHRVLYEKVATASTVSVQIG